MAKEKPNKGFELISPDKIKTEPDDMSPVPVSKPSVSVSKTLAVLTSPLTSTVKTSSSQPKTILLVQTVNSRTGGIQSLLLPQGLRNLPTTSSDLTLTTSRSKPSPLLTVTSTAGKSHLSIAPRMAECLLTSATGLMVKAASPQMVQSQIQAQTDIKSIVKLSSAVPVVPPKVCELTFNSRTIKADGTVCTLKEYLCNFCQYKVASQEEFREHFLTHVFSCNYCTFRAFTRYEVLSHKKEKHQGIAEELAGYEGLDSFSDQMNSLIAEWQSQTPATVADVPLVSSQMAVSTIPTITTSEAAASTDVDSPSVVMVTPKLSTSMTVSSTPSVWALSSASPISVLSSPSPLVSVSRSFTLSTPVSHSSSPALTSASTSLVTASLLSQKKTTVITSSTISSPVVIPASTVKTTASVGKSNDNYFTYKIVHDAAGKVQAYECDVCTYRSTKINEIFAHASTHSLTDLMKSNSVNVQWECFYCCFTSVLQANVVSHVIAKHPSKPIQLKRMVTNSTQRSTSRSVLLRNPTLSLDPVVPAKTTSPSIKKEKNAEEASAAAASLAAKKPDEADDGCMWGCYYCSVQSVDRNEIILHLKKDHAQQKLVITRRRITHIPTPHSAKTDGKSDTTEITNDLQLTDGEMISSERTKSDVQIGDIDSTDPQHSLLKSRRKQVFPRKVAEDAANDEAGETSKASELSETASQTSKGKRKSQTQSKSKELSELGDVKQLDTKRSRKSDTKQEESVKRMKCDNRTQKDMTKMADSSVGVNGGNDVAGSCAESAVVIDGHNGIEDASMPALEDLSNFIKPKPVLGKNMTELSLSNEPVAVTAAAAVTGCPPIDSVLEPDKEMPILHPELSVPPPPPADDANVTNDQSSFNGSKDKADRPLEETNMLKDWPDDVSVDESKFFHFDSTTAEAHCKLCGKTTQGLSARNLMREHIMIHTGGHLWICPCCPFKCGRRSMMLRHVQTRHKNCPLHLIQRRTYSKSVDVESLTGLSGSGSSVPKKMGLSSNRVLPGKPRGCSIVSKLQGPRSAKERKLVKSSTHVWQCPFCGRRNLFKGALRIHIKVAHPAEDCDVKFKRLPRPTASQGHNKPLWKEAIIDVVPIEHMHLYESLSTLLLDNGMSLIHDLDIDDDVEEAGEERSVINHNPKYQCMHCHIQNLDLQLVKAHILQVHPGDLVAVVDHRASRKTQHLFLCKNPECSFSTGKQDLLKTHCCKSFTTENEKAKSSNGQTDKLPSVESHPLPEASPRVRTQPSSCGILDAETGILTTQVEPQKSVDISVNDTRHEFSNLTSNFRKRLKTPEGPIDYNDDGTLKGIELEHGSMMLQCRYCDYPKTSDPVEIKVHLASKHPRLQPIAIDVDASDKGGLACLFVCSVFGCDYSSHYSNVFEHHMNLEHPDVESARLVKKKRSYKRTSEKFRVQNDVVNIPDQTESSVNKQVIEENRPPRVSSKSSDDCSKDPLPSVILPSPEASTFSQPTPSPVGTTVGSDASTAFGDGQGLGSSDDQHTGDASHTPAKDARALKKPRLKPMSFDYPCRYECVQCSFRIGTPEEMKSHLVAKHRENYRSFYCIDRRARELRKRQKVLFCHNEHCGFYCKFEEELEDHENYACTFSAGVRRHQKPAQEGALQYMDSVVKMNPGGLPPGEKLYPMGSSRGPVVDDVNNKMYQCSHCTFITTDLHNIRMHVIAEHAATEGGFAEIKTELGTDGNIVMNVNDRGVNELMSKSALNMNLVCEKNVIRESRSMYDAVDTVKIDDEEKVYTVL